MQPTNRETARNVALPPANVVGAGWRARLKRNQRFAWIALGVVVLLLIIWLLIPSGVQRGGHGRFGASGPMPVGVAAAHSADVHVTLNALGAVTPLATVDVRPQVGGQLVKINFREGQMVKAGDILAEIDPRPYRAALDQAKGALARDRAALANARVDLTRYQTLYAQKAISQQTLATQAALVKQDEGVVAADNANVDAAALNLTYTKIIAPVSGRVGLRQVDLGNLVTAGQADDIAVVTQLEPISVLFTVPEDNIDEILDEVRGGAVLEADAYDRSQTTKLAVGKLASIDNVVDPTTGTVKLRAMFDNADHALFPNQFVNIRLLVRTLHDQTVVPASAVQLGAQGSYVYVVNPDKTVSMRTVTPGVTDNGNVQITKGLKPGDTVVTDGADRLSDGAQITIPNATSQTISTPSAAPAGSAPPEARRSGRHGLSRLLRKLTPDERASLRAMSREERMAWFKAHRSELEKRPDRAGGPNGSAGGGGAPP